MTWNYRVIKEKDTAEGFWYSFREVYYDEAGNIEGWTAESCSPGGVTIEELKNDLNYMLEALEHPVLDLEALQASRGKR